MAKRSEAWTFASLAISRKYAPELARFSIFSNAEGSIEGYKIIGKAGQLLVSKPYPGAPGVPNDVRELAFAAFRSWQEHQES